MFKSRTTKYLRLALLASAWILSAAMPAQAGERFITVASTTSTDNSGLFAHILPQFEQETGINVRTVIVGTGRAINLAQRGDADVLFVHHKPSEEKFVRDGYGVKRYDVMYNDFVIVGPHADPAGIKSLENAAQALQKIAARQAAFASRGDDSGTNKKERELWVDAGIKTEPHSGKWYRETGSSMGATLNFANAVDAYTLTDRGTWMSFANKDNLTLMVEGDPPLFNQYGLILVNPAKHPHVKAEDGQRFIDWLISRRGQQAIASFKTSGKQLFFPNASEALQATPAKAGTPGS